MNTYVFKTNISSQKKAGILLNLLPYYHKIGQITFDFVKGCGIFTVAANDLAVTEVQSTIKTFGYRCKVIQKPERQR